MDIYDIHRFCNSCNINGRFRNRLIGGTYDINGLYYKTLISGNIAIKYGQKSGTEPAFGDFDGKGMATNGIFIMPFSDGSKLKLRE